MVTIDSIAARIGWSLDGRFAVAVDPPVWQRAGATRPQQRGPRDPAGMRLRVLDSSGRNELALLLRDDAAFGVSQYGSDRVYVSSFRGIAAFDARTWTEVARRQLDTFGRLVGAMVIV